MRQEEVGARYFIGKVERSVVILKDSKLTVPLALTWFILKGA